MFLPLPQHQQHCLQTACWAEQGNHPHRGVSLVILLFYGHARFQLDQVLYLTYCIASGALASTRARSQGCWVWGSMSWHQSLLLLFARCCKTVCSQPVSLITPTTGQSPGLAPDLALNKLLCLHAAMWSQHKESVGNWWWAGEGKLGHRSWEQLAAGSVRCGVKPSPHRDTDQSTTSACSSKRQQAFSNLRWWWDRWSLFNTPGVLYNCLCAVADSYSPPSPPTMYVHTRACTHPHTLTSFLVWKNAPRGAAHPRTQLCLCLESWWITVGNLKSLQLSDLYQKMGAAGVRSIYCKLHA